MERTILNGCSTVSHWLQVVNRVQRLRKEAKLVSTDEATVYIEFPAKVCGIFYIWNSSTK